MTSQFGHPTNLSQLLHRSFWHCAPVYFEPSTCTRPNPGTFAPLWSRAFHRFAPSGAYLPAVPVRPVPSGFPRWDNPRPGISGTAFARPLRSPLVSVECTAALFKSTSTNIGTFAQIIWIQSKPLTIDVQSCRMGRFSSSVLRYARILASILDHDVAYVHVSYHIPVHRYVVANHEPENKREIKHFLSTTRTIINRFPKSQTIENPFPGRTTKTSPLSIRSRKQDWKSVLKCYCLPSLF